MGISLDQYHAKMWAIKILSNEAVDKLLLPHRKLFSKAKRGLELVSLPHLLHDFWRKIFLLLYSINWPSFTVPLPLLPEILCNIYVLQLFVNQVVCDVINFEINLIFLIKLFFLYDQKVRTKNSNILRRKRTFKVK